MLSVWVERKKCKPEEYHTDARYLKLCKILNLSSLSGIDQERASDLKLVLSVTADDNLAKLVNMLSLSQMVKVSIIVGFMIIYLRNESSNIGMMFKNFCDFFT